MEKQKIPAGAYIAYSLLVFAVVVTGLFFCGDAFNERLHHDGWRYLLALVFFDLVFTLAALVYLFRTKWPQVGYAIVLALPLNCIGSFRQLALVGFIMCCILLVAIIAFRKKLIQ